MNFKKTISSMQGIALDSINNADKGHIGMAIGAAPITYTLIGELLNFSQENFKWINRDRFILSAGHASMSLYSIMHFFGFLTIQDMKNHKKLYSKTPSHPEVEDDNFVDASTGPLGQGVAMGVGMVISQHYLSKKYNKNEFKIFDHNIFVLFGDGCFEEGASLEAIQLAGTLKLNKLILIQDFNNMQIDSQSAEVNNVDHLNFFKSQGFEVFEVKNPEMDQIKEAILKAKKSTKPSYIKINTIIATNTPYANTPSGHFGSLTKEETIDFKKKINLKSLDPFNYDQDVYDFAQTLLINKQKNYQKWLKMFENYKKKFSQEHQEIKNLFENKINNSVLDVKFNESNVATRNYIIPIMQQLETQFNVLAGSADLAASTKVKFKKNIKEGGKYIMYGARELAMSAINNGIFLHSNLRTIDSTFLVFADLAKLAYRLGAIMKIPAIHVLTHDSYQVGGDGPTHQAFDQLAMLRGMSNVKILRPCDESEMKLSFQEALETKNKQIFIIGCRQPIKSFNIIKNYSKLPSAYLIKKTDFFDISLLASGSEVSLIHEVALELEKHNIKAQVVSVPNLKGLLDKANLIKELNIDKKPIFAVEASSDNTWYKLSKYNKFDCFLAKGYGYSAPGQIVYELKGFEKNNLVSKIMKFLNKKNINENI